MKLSRKNYAVGAVCAFMLSVAAGIVLTFDDRANAAGKGVDLQAPAGCARQDSTREFTSYADPMHSSISSASGAFYSHIPTGTSHEEAC